MSRIYCVVPPEAREIRIDLFLAKQEGIRSRGEAQRLIREGHVYLNDRLVQRPSYKIVPGERLFCEVPEPKPSRLVPLSIALNILYEDSHLVVVNKPPHMVVHPAPGHLEDTLVNALLAHTQTLAVMGGSHRPGIVHRLDKGTSGILIVAKSDVAFLSLTKQFKERQVKKTYHALVYGQMEGDTGIIEHAITRSGRDRKRMTVVRVPGEGREAVTTWEVIKTFPGLSFLKLSPQTGRTHQLRVHLSAVGHPIVGDPVYGRRRFPPTGVLAPLKGVVRALRRQALHASKITFLHPVTGLRLTFEAPCPGDLRSLLQKLEEMFGEKG